LLEFKPLTVIVLLQKLQPIFAITLAAILLKEKINRRFIAWGSLALAAGYTLTFGLELPDFQTNGNTLKASGYAILAAAAFGSSTVFSKKAVGSMSFRTATFFRYGLTSVIMLTYVAINNTFTNISLVTPFQWGIFLIIAFTTGSGAIFLYYMGLIRVRAMVATMCELFFPISAVIFDYLINGAILTTMQWISAVVMVGAIIKLTISNNSSGS
ncbi:MAG: EamA family transporter, partial [Bacteroidetes bacterium HGW-Bacteroidetes-22]